MSRIVAGCAKGVQIAVPKKGTRPTSERVREALFSRLDHWGYLRGAVVADLYAGSGALGLEAASRGAASVTFVEANPGAARLIAKNIRTAGFATPGFSSHVAEDNSPFSNAASAAPNTRPSLVVVTKKVETYLTIDPSETPLFNLALLDPPYDLSDETLDRVIDRLANHLASDALIVVERDKRSPEPAWPDGWDLVDGRTMGDTRLWYAQRTDPAVR